MWLVELPRVRSSVGSVCGCVMVVVGCVLYVCMHVSRVCMYTYMPVYLSMCMFVAARALDTFVFAIIHSIPADVEKILVDPLYLIRAPSGCVGRVDKDPLGAAAAWH